MGVAHRRTTATASVTAQIVEEILDATPDDLGQRTRARTHRLLVDTAVLSYAGMRTVGGPIAQYARTEAASARATCFGASLSATAELAAGVNAQTARDMDFEEAGPGLHAGTIVAATAMAVGQEVGASGEEVMLAAALGYEINARFHYARRDGLITRHLTVAAAITAAKLRGLDAEQCDRALSIAWDSPVRMSALQRPPAPKRVSRVGMASLWLARFGVQATRLAQFGFEAPSDEIDQQGDDYDLEVLRPRPGFPHLDAELMLKPWPASRLSHGALQILEELVTSGQLAAEDVVEVRLGLPAIYLRPHQYDPAPTRYWEAIYSVQWAVSMVLLGVEPGLEWFAESTLGRPEAKALAAKVTVVEVPEATADFDEKRHLDVENVVEVVTAGESLTRRIRMRDVLGSPDAPMPDDRFERKLRRLLEATHGDSVDVDSCLSGLLTLDRAESIEEPLRSLV